MARTVARQREWSVRIALGAGRWRLERQSLTESLLLALLGGAAGVVVALGLQKLFVSIAPEGIPRLAQASIDLRVLAFTLALTVLSVLAFARPVSLHAT